MNYSQMTMEQNSRRNFLKKSALTAGLTTIGNIGLAESIKSDRHSDGALNPAENFHGKFG
jgi:hypothetical protein